MSFESDDFQIIEERRLTGTMITRKPNPKGSRVALMTVLVIGFTSVLFWTNWLGAAHLWPAVNSAVFTGGEVWRLLTALFIHGDFGHYLSNMYMLGIFSFFTFGYFGWNIFLSLGLAGGALVNALAIATYGPNIRLLGASGVVYLLGGFWLAVYFFVQRQYSVTSRLVRIFGMGLIIFFPTSFVENTSYRTHAIGFVVGLVLGAIYFWRNKARIRSQEIYKVSYVTDEPQFH